MTKFKRSISFFLILSSLLIFFASFFISCNKVDKIEKEFNKMAKLFMTKDFKNAVDYFPPAIVKKAGKQNLVTGMEKFGSQFYTVDIEDIHVDNKSTEIRSNDTIYSLLMCKQKDIYTINTDNVSVPNMHALYSNIGNNPNISDIKWIKPEKQFEAISSNIFLAVSYNSGEKWYFIAATNKNTIDLLVPNPEHRKLIDRDGKDLVKQAQI